MAISTINSHIETAIQMQERQSSAYVVIGKSSAWSDENNPPNEDMNTSEISEVIGYKKVSQFSLARPLADNENAETVGYPVVSYASQNWVLVPKVDAYKEGARWLYVEAKIRPEDFPLGEYRQVGFQLGVEPKAGVTKHNLLPSEILSKGILKFFENREQQNRTSRVYVVEQFLMKV